MAGDPVALTVGEEDVHASTVKEVALFHRLMRLSKQMTKAHPHLSERMAGALSRLPIQMTEAHTEHSYQEDELYYCSRLQRESREQGVRVLKREVHVLR